MKGKQPAGSLCVDTNECVVDDPCDQHCTNLAGTFKCGCMPGYKLMTTSKCQAINDPPSEPASLLISTAETIQRMTVNGGTIDQISALDSYALDFNHRNNSVCWISHTTPSSQSRAATPSSLQCTKIGMSKGWILPQPDMLPYSSVDKIALDWASGNWYYVDESRETVFLCRVEQDQQYCAAVFVTKRNKPRGVALDPSAGNIINIFKKIHTFICQKKFFITRIIVKLE